MVHFDSKIPSCCLLNIGKSYDWATCGHQGGFSKWKVTHDQCTCPDHYLTFLQDIQGVQKPHYERVRLLWLSILFEVRKSASIRRMPYFCPVFGRSIPTHPHESIIFLVQHKILSQTIQPNVHQHFRHILSWHTQIIFLVINPVTDSSNLVITLKWNNP